MRYYTHLSVKERRQIAAFLQMGWSPRAIAQRLGRHPATVYRELKRNQTHRHYFPIHAHEKAQQRHQRSPYKLFVDSRVYKYVLAKLQLGWSPEQIAGRMKQQTLAQRVCHETIYQYIYKHARSHLFDYLPTQRQRRRVRRQRHHRQPYQGIRALKNRPLEALSRQVMGHWEGDTIRFAQQHKPSVTTLVERKSRQCVLMYNPSSTSQIVMDNITDKMLQFPKKVWRTITFDQGSEFADFARIERHTRCNVYYAQARSPWQRGTNENTNGRLRRYLPRSMDPRSINQTVLDLIADTLNNTPRKCLDFLTPNEVFLSRFLTDCRT